MQVTLFLHNFPMTTWRWLGHPDTKPLEVFTQSGYVTQGRHSQCLVDIFDVTAIPRSHLPHTRLVTYAEMCDDLADYAGTGRRPGGLRLASLQGPRSTDNFWTTTLVSLQYLLGLTLTHSIVTRIPHVSSTSAPSPKSRAHGHFSLPTLLPRFPLFLPFVFLDLFFILFPSQTVTNLPLCPDLMTTFPCDALMRSYDTLWLLMFRTLLIEQSSVV